jgi:YggT family protein
MGEGALFLVQTLFNLYIMAVVLRIWLQLARADFFNPLSQFIVKVTNPVLKPLQQIIPSAGRLDLAAVLLAVVLSIASTYAILALQDALGRFDFMSIATYSVMSLISTVLQLMFWIIFIRAILSWFSSGRNPLELVMIQLTEPLLAPVRRIIPPIGGLDLSVIVVLVLIQFIRIVIGA